MIPTSGHAKGLQIYCVLLVLIKLLDIFWFSIMLFFMLFLMCFSLLITTILQILCRWDLNKVDNISLFPCPETTKGFLLPIFYFQISLLFIYSLTKET
jgi:hypothetical protein